MQLAFTFNNVLQALSALLPQAAPVTNGGTALSHLIVSGS